MVLLLHDTWFWSFDWVQAKIKLLYLVMLQPTIITNTYLVEVRDGRPI